MRRVLAVNLGFDRIESDRNGKCQHFGLLRSFLHSIDQESIVCEDMPGTHGNQSNMIPLVWRGI